MQWDCHYFLVGAWPGGCSAQAMGHSGGLEDTPNSGVDELLPIHSIHDKLRIARLERDL